MIKYSRVNLGQIEAVLNKLGRIECGLQKFLADELVIKERNLQRITAVPVFGTEKFIARDHLKPANISCTGSDFDKFFLEKVDENIKGLTVAVHRLEKDSLSIPIIAELGGCAEINLVHLFQLIEKQSKGEDGLLLTDGTNIAYIRGTDGNLWVVVASWTSMDWYVCADRVGYPRKWSLGSQVLSRDS
jgi:hypothetical protein